MSDVVDLADYDQIYRASDGQMDYVGRVSVLGKDGTPRGAQEREHEHTYAAMRGEIRNCARLLSKAMIEKGPEAFTFEILETVEKSRGAEREIFWINSLNTVAPNGYNLMGGEGDRFTTHPDTKELMRRSHKSFGKDAQKRFNITVERKIVKETVGYRGFYNGVPKGFFSNTLTETEKKAQAIHYHLTGKSEHERRIPRNRLHSAEGAVVIKQPGVKANYNEYGRLRGYRAYHPTNTSIRSETFDNLDDAIARAKLLISFPEDKVPQEYLVVPQVKHEDRFYLKSKRAKLDTKFVKAGEVYGFSVDVPKIKIDPDATRLNLKTLDITKTPEENLKNARLVRNSILKTDS